MITMIDEPPEGEGYREADLEEVFGTAALFTEVKRAPLIRLLDHIRERALQNHAMHASWNEGASGDFKECTRGDCTEARSILTEWQWL